MVVLSWCWRGPRRQALRDLRKGLGISSEGGNTGRRTDWPCHINIAKKVRLLRPSVQLPAGIHGCAVYKDFERAGKRSSGVWSRIHGRRQVALCRRVDIFVCISYKYCEREEWHPYPTKRPPN